MLYPVRATTPERTLLDGPLQPKWSGGFANVLGAWVRHRDLIDVEALVRCVEQFGVGVLRQRAGFLMEEPGLRHPVLQGWVKQARRGGSSELNGGADVPFDVNLNEPICRTARFDVATANLSQVCDLEDIVAKRLRALLQQPIRNRHRRQDVIKACGAAAAAR